MNGGVIGLGKERIRLRKLMPEVQDWWGNIWRCNSKSKLFRFNGTISRSGLLKIGLGIGGDSLIRVCQRKEWRTRWGSIWARNG